MMGVESMPAGPVGSATAGASFQVRTGDGEQASMQKNIGYLIPQFPGQTHNFFWSEANALRTLGVSVGFVSTRLPPPGLQSTSWGREAVEQTDYIYPFRLRDGLRLLKGLAHARWRGMVECLRICLSAPDLDLKSRLKLLPLVLVSMKLGAIARERGWSHVHVHSCADSANLALFARLICNLSYSLTLHNPLDVYGGNQQAKFGYSRFAIFITEAIRQDARARLGGSFPEHSVVAPMGVDLDLFRRGNAYLPYSGSGEFRVVSCARLNPAKGHKVLIDAAVAAKAMGVPIVVDFIGEDDSGGAGFRKELERHIAEREAGDIIRLAGAISAENVRDALQRSHCFVLASFNEPLGVAIMEAMAMQVPVISTRAGGVPTLIEDSVDGILVEPGSSQQLAAALVRLAGSPQLALEMASRSRGKIELGYSFNVSAKAISGLLQGQTGERE